MKSVSVYRQAREERKVLMGFLGALCGLSGELGFHKGRNE